jgi:tetratricopeptide (TPR) repeat protein
LERLPLWIRLANVPLAYVRYVSKAFWPHDLAVFYPYDVRPSLLAALAALVALAIASGAAIWAARRGYAFAAVGWFWFLGTLVPAIGIVQVGEQAIADRYTYMPLVGLFIIVVWGAAHWLDRWRHARWLEAGAAGVAAAACLALTANQLRYWQNTDLLLEHALQVAPGNYLAHNNLGVLMWERGKADEAMAHWKESIRFAPKSADAYYKMGFVLARLGRSDEAYGYLTTAMRLAPLRSDTRFELAEVLWKQGKQEEAIAIWREAVKIPPASAKGYTRLGCAFVARNALPEAIDCFRQAVACEPGSFDAHHNLGLALWQQGQHEVALVELQEAILIQPGSVVAHMNLARIFAQQGQLAPAAVQLQEVLRLDPSRADAARDLTRVSEALQQRN